MSQVSDVGEAPPTYSLTLYIAGDSDLSRRAEGNLRQIIESQIPGQYDLQVIDVVANPRMAIQERVTITPMVVKTAPQPLRKIIGDFTDKDKVLRGLGVEVANYQDES